MTGQYRILAVDDSPPTLEVIRRNLSSEGYTVLTASCAEEAIKVLDAERVDLVITDLKMPGPSGLELIRYVRENHPDTEIMMVTGYATVEGAVEAVKTGANEYIAKPFTEKELLSAVARVLEMLSARRRARSPQVAGEEAPTGFIGHSTVMKSVYQAIGKAARTSAAVLITGESGTGKELVARAVHYGGPRAAASFVAVNCGGIPESLLESELFGHVRGAFTGATETRAGFFQTADGGTIFLDEVSETSLAMQVKLLRVLEEKEVRMLGSTRSQHVNVRVVAATNKDLSSQVAKGQFRDDLYYRLNVIAIDLPPLRDRGDDILVLINHFLRKFADEAERMAPRFSDDALRVIRSYHWPGNVRELQNVIHRMVVMIDHELIDVPDLPSLMRCAVPREAGFRRTLAEVETEYVRNVLASVKGNKTRAAEILGIDRKTLREKINRSRMAEDMSS